jgi:hypothetical protein
LGLLAQLGKGGFAADGLDAAALNVVITAAEQVADLGQLSEVSAHSVLDEFIGSAAGRRSKLLEKGFGFGLKVNDHNSQSSEEEDVGKDARAPQRIGAREAAEDAALKGRRYVESIPWTPVSVYFAGGLVKPWDSSQKKNSSIQ